MKLQELIDQYVAFRKSMGEDFESAESLLKTFSRRMGLDIDLSKIRAKQVQVFLAGAGPIKLGPAIGPVLGDERQRRQNIHFRQRQ